MVLFPSAFTWVLRIELRSPCLQGKLLSLLNHLANPQKKNGIFIVINRVLVLDVWDQKVKT